MKKSVEVTWSTPQEVRADLEAVARAVPDPCSGPTDAYHELSHAAYHSLLSDLHGALSAVLKRGWRGVLMKVGQHEHNLLTEARKKAQEQVNG
jgi:hypothetical protein